MEVYQITVQAKPGGWAGGGGEQAHQSAQHGAGRHAAQHGLRLLAGRGAAARLPHVCQVR